MAKYGDPYSEFVHTHSSENTPGAVGSQCCGTQGAVGDSVPWSHLSRGIEGGESAGYSLSRWLLLSLPPPTIPARPGTRTCNLWVTSPTL